MLNIMLLINKRNALILGIIFASIGYLFSIKLASIGIIFLLAFWILNFKDLNLRAFLKKNILHLTIIFFVFLLIGIIHSLDFQHAKNFTIRHLSFLLLPLVFLTIKPFAAKEYNFIIKFFICTVTLFFLICLCNAIYRQVVFSNQGGIFNWYFFYRYDFLEIFSQHPTYVSMYTLLSLSFLLDNGRNLFKKHWIYISLIFIQIVSIVLYGSRIAYIILFILFFVYTTRNLKFKSKKEKVKLGVIYTLSTLTLLVVSWNIPIVKERIQFTFGYQQKYKFNNEEFIKNNTPEEQGRLLLWKNAFELIKKAPIFGYGTGSNYVVLLKKYKEKNHVLFLKKKYNAHNTYIEILLIGGVTLLVVYLIILGALLHQGFIRKDFVLLSFFLIIGISGLTETLFKVQGIVFFALFYCFLLSFKKNE